MAKNTSSICMLLFLCGSALTEAQAPLTLGACRPPEDPTRKDFLIDAARESATGARKYQASAEVRIILINKNPFANDYKLAIEEAEVAEPALQRFVGAFAFINAVTPELAPQDGDRAGAPAPPPALDDPCQRTLAQLSAIRQQIEDRNRQIREGDAAVHRDFNAQSGAYNNLVNALSPSLQVLARDKVDCGELRPAVESFTQSVRAAEGSLDLQPLRRKMTEFKELLSGQIGLLQAYQDAAGPGCQSEIEDFLTNRRNQVTVTTINLNKLEAKLDELDAAIRRLREQRKNLEEIGSRTEAFYEVHNVGPFDVPTDVTIELKTRKRNIQNPEDFKLAVREKLNFGGGPIFSLSAGIAFANFEEQTFKRVQGFARATPGAEPDRSMLRPVVGLDQDSDWRTAPLVLIHARFWETRGSRLGVHASFGLSAKIENGDTEAEYLAGFSLSFTKNLFFTLGGYYGGFDRLAGDLFEGAALPMDVPEPPVKVDHTWKPGLALTYRIQ